MSPLSWLIKVFQPKPIREQIFRTGTTNSSNEHVFRFRKSVFTCIELKSLPHKGRYMVKLLGKYIGDTAYKDKIPAGSDIEAVEKLIIKLQRDGVKL